MARTTNFKLMFWLLIARLLPHFILTLEEDSVWDKCLIFASYPQVSLELERSHSLVYQSQRVMSSYIHLCTLTGFLLFAVL